VGETGEVGCEVRREVGGREAVGVVLEMQQAPVPGPGPSPDDGMHLPVMGQWGGVARLAPHCGSRTATQLFPQSTGFASALSTAVAEAQALPPKSQAKIQPWNPINSTNKQRFDSNVLTVNCASERNRTIKHVHNL